MTASRNVLTPDALNMMDTIARTGSFAAASRELGRVPSSLTYSVRQLEEALDVLLFDRRSRQARLTPAGTELLVEGRRLLDQMGAVANRVKRVATGWETQLTIAVDGVISRLTMFELCESFYALCPKVESMRSGVGNAAAPAATVVGPGTRLRLRTEVMSGTWEAITSGQADLAIGVGAGAERSIAPGVQTQELGTLAFVFAVAPHHALASAAAPISDAELMRHRAVAVADSAQRLTPATFNLMPGQDVLTVGSMQLKIEAQIRGIGCGFVPEPLVRSHLAAGRLVAKAVERSVAAPTFGYAWRTPDASAPGVGRKAQPGMALQWWLAQLEHPATRSALLDSHGQTVLGGM